MSCGVYKLTAPNGNCYIGSSYRVVRRLTNHRSDLRLGTHRNRRLQGAFRKYGPLKEEVLLVCREQDLIFYEQLCIDGFKPEYNQSQIAGHTEMTKELRAKLSAARKGKPLSPEHRAKMSAAAKGKAKSPEHHAKTREHLARLNAARKGKPLTASHRESVRNGQKRHFEEKTVHRDEATGRFREVPATSIPPEKEPK